LTTIFTGQNHYALLIPSPSLPNGTTTDNDDGSSTKTNGGVIGSAVVGGIVVFAAIAFIIFKRRRKRQNPLLYSGTKGSQIVEPGQVQLLPAHTYYTSDSNGPGNNGLNTDLIYSDIPRSITINTAASSTASVS